ncbi:MAG: methyltransferase domain-containing protein [Myxococcales bacterium]|nr:methyltransferase domain-containing protein [Myxococcales bacterium]
MSNVDHRVVDDFGAEWTRFDQTRLDDDERARIFDAYFRVFPWERLPADAVGFDLGAGTGRWAKQVAPRVGRLHVVEPSAAIDVARRMLADAPNVELHQRTVDELPFEDGSMDFGYSLGVLHHIPDTTAALRACVRKLKPGAPFLVYLYYAFDNRPRWFRSLWRASDLARRGISRLPHRAKHFVSEAIAGTVYLPLARTARLLERVGADVSAFPLSAYRHHSFYTMRTDALDRFGTRLEQRFTADEIRALMRGAGLVDVEVSPTEPFWCAVGYKAR